MKRIFILAALLCIFCLTGCGSKEDGIGDANQEQRTLEGNITEAGNGDKEEIGSHNLYP